METFNALRGDVRLDLAGTSYILRPSFAALAMVEREVAPILQLVQRAGDADVRIEEMAQVFHYCCLRPIDGDIPDVASFGQLILSDGLMSCLSAYRSLLTAILGPGPDENGL